VKRFCNEEVIKKYYKTTEVSEIVGLSTTTIRLWTQRFNIPHTIRPRKGRMFEQRDIDKLIYIKFLIYNRQFTIKGALQEIALKGYVSPYALPEIIRNYTVLLINSNYYRSNKK
jgi:hypothetical protein